MEAQVRQDLTNAVAMQQGLVDKVSCFEADIETSVTRKEKPFPGASEIHIPLTFELLDTARLMGMKVVLSNRPLLVANVPKRVKEPLRGQLSQAWMHFLDTVMFRGGIEKALYDAWWHSLISGTGIIRTTWASPQQQRQPGVVSYTGVRYEFIHRKDFVVLPTNSPSLSAAKGCGHRFWSRLSKVKKLGREGYYYKDASEKIPGNRPATEMGPSELQKEIIGIQAQTLLQPDDAPVELWQILWSWDPNDRGEESLWLLTVEASGVLLRAVKYPFDHGRPCYTQICPKPRPLSVDGISLAGLLDGINSDLDAQHRMFIDAHMRNIMPVIQVPPSQAERYEGKPITPGRYVVGGLGGEMSQVTNPITATPDLGSTLFVREHGERLIGVGPTMQGQPIDTHHSATEVMHYQQAGSAKMDDIIRNIYGYTNQMEGTGLCEIGYQTMCLYHQYWDEWQSDITQPEWPQEFPRESMKFPIELLGNGMSVMALPETQRAMYLQLWALFNMDPMLQAKPILRVRLANRLASYFDMGTDWLPTEQEVQEAMNQAQGIPQQQQQQYIQGGGAGPVNPMI